MRKKRPDPSPSSIQEIKESKIQEGNETRRARMMKEGKTTQEINLNPEDKKKEVIFDAYAKVPFTVFLRYCSIDKTKKTNKYS